MSSRLLLGETPESVDAPSFTCEVCKISVRSAQKLLDHVNFSPLHKAALEGGECAGTPNSPFSARIAHRRILYDGTKLFWRINETLDICIFEDAGANLIAVTAAPQQITPEQLPIPPLVLDRRSVLMAMTTPSRRASEQQTAAALADAISAFVLARLNATRDADSSSNATSLVLQKLTDDEREVSVLPQYATLLASDFGQRRRRHTMDEVKSAEQEAHAAAAELKKAREQAEHLSSLARMTLEAFASQRAAHGAARNSEWIRAIDRVKLRQDVDRSRRSLLAMQGSKPS